MGKIKFEPVILIAAFVVAFMAMIHGIIGESALTLLRGVASPAIVLSAALPLFALLVLALWKKDNLVYWLGLSVGDKPHSHASGPLASAIGIFVLMSLAQGVVALSAAHLAAHYSHHAYGLMLIGGLILFLLGTIVIWRMRDSLFHVDAKAEEINLIEWPFHVAVVNLSTAGRGELSDIDKDKTAFELANSEFDRLVKKENWEVAIRSLIVDRSFGTQSFWNFQQPIRLFETMANSKFTPNKRRAMIFVTTNESDERWHRAKDLLTKLAESMPADKGPKIAIRCLDDMDLLLKKYPTPASRHFDKSNFNPMFHLFRDIISAIKLEYGLPSRSVAIDTTSGTKEMSIIGAIATIDSHVAFTYVDTSDKFRARRFDARAIAVGISE